MAATNKSGMCCKEVKATAVHVPADMCAAPWVACSQSRRHSYMQGSNKLACADMAEINNTLEQHY